MIRRPWRSAEPEPGRVVLTNSATCPHPKESFSRAETDNGDGTKSVDRSCSACGYSETMTVDSRPRRLK